ncbi:MAG: hypothetical protein PHC60_06620 [Heliobacteriaceae bacterium]|nr:hypothetical protein [Heliobacteriaceae bacterium]MDD4588041.1 hypothetical protein [Heliobacteriaceae bacterium]
MFFRFVLGFLIASASQLMVMFMFDIVGIPVLLSPANGAQILVMLVIGQVAGWFLWLLISKNKAFAIRPHWVIGSIYGTLVWIVVGLATALQGQLTFSWAFGPLGLLVSWVAFGIFGIVAAATAHLDDKVRELRTP